MRRSATGGIEHVQFFAGLEADGFAGGDADLGAGAWVAANACLAGAHAEDAKSAQLNAIASGQCLLQTLKNGVDSGFGLGARQSGTFNDVMDDILFDQSVCPLTDVKSRSSWNCPLRRCYCELAALSISAFSNTISNLGTCKVRN